MFVFAYFRTEAEALHLAISEDGLDWNALNDNKPVLAGTVNTCTLRDPFIMQDRKGLYHLFATDGSASRYIVHATSADLLDWSEQEALPVMINVEGARNSWAPECFYDHQEDLFRIIWSSTVDAQPSTGADSRLWRRDHRIWQTTTECFKNYTPSALFFDPGFNVIDATVGYHNGEYLMAFKDERGENRAGTDYKAIRVSRARSAGGPFDEYSELVTPALVEGPALFRKSGRWIMLYDHFMEGGYGASQSEDGVHWDVITEQINFPSGSRHGSVLEVDGAVADKLKTKVV